MKLLNARGTRDVPPDEAASRQQLIRTMQEVFELFGYRPLETPVLERSDVLTSKYAGGDEILKEMFALSDQGKRDLALRYDLTVPMCRYIAMNPQLRLPFKRYQIAPVFRDGPIKSGRYRQFMQCDVDVVGSSHMSADAEMIDISRNVFSQLGLDVKIKVNNRKLLNGILDHAGIKADLHEAAILAIDKIDKVGKKAVLEELQQRGILAKNANALFDTLPSGSREEKVQKLSVIKNDYAADGLKDITMLFEIAGDDLVEFDPTLARGLAYYTGTVFEAFVPSSEIKSSVAGGGRYDKMIGLFLGKNQEYPAVGISFGLDVIFDIMQEKKLISSGSHADIYVIPINQAAGASKVANRLRAAGIKTDIDLMNRNISKNLSHINLVGIPYAVIIGEQELKEGKIKLRDMKSGDERLVTVDEAIDQMKRSEN